MLGEVRDCLLEKMNKQAVLRRYSVLVAKREISGVSRRRLTCSEDAL